jgi:adenosylmethionine-8-amino-7-oxononanoate aminotransferase
MTLAPVRSAYPLWHPMTDMSYYLEEPITIVRGEGVLVYDEDGRDYLSATSGLWNVSCGFGRPEIIEAVTDQLNRLPYGTLFRFGNEPALRFARRLADLLPGELNRVFFSSSGAAAIDTALKLARRYQRLEERPGKRAVVCLADSYHGTSIGAMAVTGEDLEQAEYGIERTDVIVLPTPTEADPVEPLRTLLAERGEEIAALIFEPILGSAGVVELPEAFLREAPALCREHDVLLIVDEVATGFGRTGRLFASEWWDLEPDLMTMSKGINSGYLPLGATAVSERVHEAFASRGAVFAHGETQAGNPLACAAALATLDVMESDELVARSERVGGELREALTRLERHPHVGAIEGRGLMLGVRLVRSRDPWVPAPFTTVLATIRQCARAGLLVHPAPAGFSLFPPLVLDSDDVERIVATLDDVLGRLRLG